MATEQLGDDVSGGAAGGDGPTLVPVTPTITRRVRTSVTSVLDKLTLADDAVLAAEPASPHLPPEPRPSGAGRRRATVSLALSLVAGLVGGVIVVGTSPLWTKAPVGWRLRVPGLQPGYGASSLYFGVTFLVGVVLMGIGWLGLTAHTGRRDRPSSHRLAVVAGAAVLWSLPFFVGPVQLSTDAYSYGAQGYMAVLGLDPSAQGPNALPHTPCDRGDTNCYWASADAIWGNAPAPYGPVAVASSEAAVIATGTNTYWTVYAFRALAVLGVALTGFGLYHIARARRVDPALALAIGVANPVVVLHLVGGAHNDALMMGLLAVGLAAWERNRRVVAVVLVTLAVCVKLPAVLALAYLAWNWRGEGRDDDWRERLKAVPVVGGIAAGIIALGCLLAGIGLGWITALSSTGKITSTFSLFTKLGFVSAQLLGQPGLGESPPLVANAFRFVGLLVAAAIMTAVLVRSPRLGVTKSTGIALLALVLCGPVMWPWYLPPAFALLAAAGVRRYRPTLIVLTIASSLIVWPTSVNAIDTLSPYQHWLGLGVVLLIAGCCVGAQYLARAAERGRRLGLKVPTIETVLITPAATTGAGAPAGAPVAATVPVSGS